MIERDANGDPWTVETLRMHLLAIIKANDQRYDQRVDALNNAFNVAFAAEQEFVKAALAAADKAVAKAETAAEKRFEALNEFRLSLSDQARLLMPRLECEKLIEAVKESVGKLELSVQGVVGRRVGSHDSTAMIIAVIAAAASVASVIILFLKHL